MITEKVLRERISNKGHAFTVLEDRFMPRIREEYLDCVIYLYYSKQDAERGAIHENGGSGFLVGRFVNHEGRQKNSPSVRFGNLAMMPGEPVYHKHSESQGEESFLVDIRTISGYSGSPVFVMARTLDTFGTGGGLALRAGGP